MSTKPNQLLSSTETARMAKQEDRTQMLANILDNININNLGQFYPKDESVFKKKIDKLNYRFYLETEKYLNNKSDNEKSQDQLFIILFKQISLYIQEIERLNILLREKIEYERINKDKSDDIFRKEKEYNSMQMLVNNLRATNKNLEKRLNEKIIAEEKMKNEIQSLERQIKFYKEKMQIELIIKKTQEMNKNRVSKRYPQDDNSQIEGLQMGVDSNTVSTEDLNKTFNKKRNNSDNNDTIKKPIGLNINEMKREITKSNNLPKNVLAESTKTPIVKKPLANSDNKPRETQSRKPTFTIKDLKIIKNVKQQTKPKGNNILTNLEPELQSPKTCSKFLNLEISNINNSNINFNLDNSYLHELILSNYNTLDDEYNELSQLEEYLLKTRQTYADTDEIRKSDSVDICNTNFSDIDDGYKSGNSCFSDSQGIVITKTKKKMDKVNSVTIDLINKEERKLKCFKAIKSNKIK
jgi:hypothetical protein